MNFLEASQILKDFNPTCLKNIKLLMSGTSDQLVMFLKAEAAKRAMGIDVEGLPFGTLQQFIIREPASLEQELFFLTPWDLVPELDWRSGVPPETVVLEDLLSVAEGTVDRLVTRENASFVYLPAPMPPLFHDDKNRSILNLALLDFMKKINAVVLDSSNFSLGTYLSTGSPVGGAQLGLLASVFVDLLQDPKPGNGKILVTDLDNVLWSGLAAEDQETSVKADPEGQGYHHYLYQTILKRLKRDGVLLAAVSRNDEDIAMAPLQRDQFVLSEVDFIIVLASYNSKSSQIKTIAQNLNLGLESFVFVDDNPVELAEVSAALPSVTCLLFPKAVDEFPRFCESLAWHFQRNDITIEDLGRTDLYRRQLSTLPPSEKDGADITTFLQSLQMKLEISILTSEDSVRAVQLINKTNQFNLNGRRIEPDELNKVIDSGGQLIVANLSDKTGSHGEIISCLITDDHRVVAWVMSCRIFQRQVEHQFVTWLINYWSEILSFDFVPTERNLPFQKFIKSICDQKLSVSGKFVVDKILLAELSSNKNLFQIKETLCDRGRS